MMQERGLRTTVWAFAALTVLALAVYLRLPAFTSPHTDPVELAYVSLAMKMGSHPGLSGYDASRIETLRKEVVETGPAGRSLPVALPVAKGSADPKSFDGWPAEDTGLFRYKPPFFASLLAYSHHQAFGPRFPIYPVSAAEWSHSSTRGRFRTLFDMQGWAVIIPFISGMTILLLTLTAGWRMFGPVPGLLAALIIAVYPAHAAVSTHIWPEATLGACILASYILMRRFMLNHNPAGCILAGAIWALAALTDTTAFLILPGLTAWTAVIQKRFFYRYSLAFAAGAGIIYQVWPDFVGKSFHASIFDLADAAFGSLLGLAPLTVAIAAGVYLYVRAVGKGASRERNDIGGLWLILTGYVAARLFLDHGAPWDERAVAPVLPFAALLAARLVPLRSRVG